MQGQRFVVLPSPHSTASSIDDVFGLLIQNVTWSEAGQLVALADEESIFVLRFDQDAVNAARQGGEGTPGVSKDLGVEAAFDVEYSVEERVRSGIWVGACYLYVSHSWRLNYVVGGEVVTVAHLDRPMYLLGYLPKEGVAVLMDKSKSVVTYPLTLSILEYQTAVVQQ